MAVSPELAKYISDARAAGMNDDAIRSELLKAGWQVGDVNEAIPARIPSFAPVVVPEKVAVQANATVKPKKSHLGFYITVLFLFAAGGAVYYFLPQIVPYIDKAIETVYPPAKAPFVDDVVRPIQQPVDETASWQTYRNEEYGFEFKYPENFEIDLPPTEDLSNSHILLTENQYQNNPMDNPSIYFTVVNLGEKTVDSFLDGESRSLSFEGDPIPLRNKIILSENPQAVLLDFGENRGILDIFDTRVYKFGWQGGYASLVEKIYSTFKFVSSATTTFPEATDIQP